MADAPARIAIAYSIDTSPGDRLAEAEEEIELLHAGRGVVWRCRVVAPNKFAHRGLGEVRSAKLAFAAGVPT